MGLMKVDTRSLDYRSCGLYPKVEDEWKPAMDNETETGLIQNYASLGL